jgi:retinol dehydrogenase-12
MAGDMDGRTVLITGATGGIGKSTAMALAGRGARLILACRSAERTAAVIDEIGRHTGRPDAGHIHIPLDLSDLASVRECANRVVALPGALHVLINNAGDAGSPGLTKDGFEPAFGINHLGPFLLTLRLVPKLRASAPARIVTISSRAHLHVKGIDFAAQRQPKRSRTGIDEYSVSKLANVLFTKELARRLAGTRVTTYCLHPGVVASGIWRRIPAPLMWIGKRFMISNDEGALTPVYCATAPEISEESGEYYDACKRAPASAVANDAGLAERLWAASAAWVGEDLLPDAAHAVARG